MKKILPLLLSLVLLGLLIWESEGSYLGRKLGLELPAPLSWEGADDHGGFLGDGLRWDTLRFSEEEGALLEERINSRGELWNSGAFDEYLGGILYDGGPAKEIGWPRCPENAYWFFKDRQKDQEKPMDQRYSWNYTAALFDANTDTLYYLEFDT